MDTFLPSLFKHMAMLCVIRADAALIIIKIIVCFEVSAAVGVQCKMEGYLFY